MMYPQDQTSKGKLFRHTEVKNDERMQYIYKNTRKSFSSIHFLILKSIGRSRYHNNKARHIPHSKIP